MYIKCLFVGQLIKSMPYSTATQFLWNFYLNLNGTKMKKGKENLETWKIANENKSHCVIQIKALNNPTSKSK